MGQIVWGFNLVKMSSQHHTLATSPPLRLSPAILQTWLLEGLRY